MRPEILGFAGFHRVLFDALPLPVFVVDSDLRVHGYNVTASALFDADVGDDVAGGHPWVNASLFLLHLAELALCRPLADPGRGSMVKMLFSARPQLPIRGHFYHRASLPVVK